MALAGLGTALLGGLKTIGGKVAGSTALNTLGNNFKSGMSNLNSNNILPNLAMIASTTAQRPGQYYVNTQWKGNGLANSGIGYLANPRYQNPYDQANLLIDLMNRRNNNSNAYDITGSAFDNNISQAGNWFNQPDYNYSGIDTSLPTAGYYQRPDWMQNYFQ